MLALTWDDPSRPFLFCVAMDPIYHYLNRIPSTLSVQCFIDDNTIAGPLHDLSWCHEVYSCYACCRTAGFQIDAHACWQAFSDSCSPFLPCPIDPQSRLLTERNLHDFPGFATVSQAIQHVIYHSEENSCHHPRWAMAGYHFWGSGCSPEGRIVFLRPRPWLIHVTAGAKHRLCGTPRPVHAP